MRKHLMLLLAVIGLLTVGGTFHSATAQTVVLDASVDKSITPSGVIGEVTNINTAESSMTIKTDAGNIVTVSLAGKTTYMRVPPGETTLDKAAKISLAEVAVGDRVFARGKVAEDRKSVPAGMVIVMTKADIAQKQERERAEWQRRGITGTVSAIDPATKQITVTVRTRETNGAPVVIDASGENMRFRRYAPNSVKFSDAKPSSFAELGVGDQIRALGDKSPDGSKFKSEEIVSGAFRTLGGTVTAVNPAANELKVKELTGTQEFTVSINKDSLLRRLPPQAAEMMVQRAASNNGGGGPAASGGGGGRRPGGAAAGGQAPAGPGGPPPGEGRPGQMGRPGGGSNAPGGGFDLQEMLERMPQITLADLKPGDVVLFSSTVSNDPTRATAITMITGLDPLVKIMQSSAARGRGAGGGPGGDLPGLDLGIGLP